MFPNLISQVCNSDKHYVFEIVCMCVCVFEIERSRHFGL